MACVVVMLLPFVAMAQTSSVNAYSPYSMYGPGELLTPGSVQMRSMGGVGIALRSQGQPNVQNPAASSMAPSKSFLFDFGFDGTHFRNNQPKYDAAGIKTSTAKTVYNTVNVHSLALTFPVAKRLGATFSIAPYSSVGYKVKTTDQNNDNWADIGRIIYGWQGDGDITEVKLSLGWEPFRNFSIGVAAKYFWGNIERNYSTTGVDRYRVNNFKMQAGIQWNIIFNEKRLFTLGATYDLGGRLNPKVEKYIYTDNDLDYPVRNIQDVNELRVPHEVGVGLYYVDRVVAWGIDYKYAMWGDNGDFSDNGSDADFKVQYSNTHTLKVGLEYTPRRSDVRNYLNRISYRVGARLGNYYQTFGGERINQMAITAGFGFPVKIWGASSVNVGFEYGRLSSPASVNISAQKVGLVTQNYFKVAVGFSLFSADTSDYWFVRPKYD